MATAFSLKVSASGFSVGVFGAPQGWGEDGELSDRETGERGWGFNGGSCNELILFTRF